LAKDHMIQQLSQSCWKHKSNFIDDVSHVITEKNASNQRRRIYVNKTTKKADRESMPI